MGLFNKIFKKESAVTKIPKGYFELTISKIVRVGTNTVEVQFKVPNELESNFEFLPGQYLNFSISINGEEYRRSYSICSSKSEDLAIAVKQIENGKISSWFNNIAKEGDSIFVARPNGHFTISNEKSIVAVAAGSGITPVLAIAKSAETNNQRLALFYGSKTFDSILYREVIDTLSNTTVSHYLSQENREAFGFGRINKEKFVEIIKTDLNLLKADGFFICGPEDMIFGVKDALEMFGVPANKIHFELFTTPTHHEEESHTKTTDFTGKSRVTVVLDDEEYEFDLDSKGKTILEAANKEGADAPYSCKGGVCSTCRAKVTKGVAVMDLNYSLTDKEIEQGYVLTCQAHPASDTVIVNYDE